MRARLTKVGVAVTALAALAVGGSQLASASSKAKPAAPVVSQEVTAPDNDNLQQGDQTSPDVAGSEAAASESESASSESASESGPSDGPGGYADSNANADTQQQGEN